MNADGDDKGPSKSALKKEAKRLAKEKEKQAKELLKAASAAQAAANSTANAGGGSGKKKEKPAPAAPEPEFVNTTPEGEKKGTCIIPKILHSINPIRYEPADGCWLQSKSR
jgi:hypothetical protein